MKKIDKNPPSLTGNINKDLSNTNDYLNYLREQLNYIITLIEKEL